MLARLPNAGYDRSQRVADAGNVLEASFAEKAVEWCRTQREVLGGTAVSAGSKGFYCALGREKPPPLNRQRDCADHQGEPEQRYEKANEVSPVSEAVMARLWLMHHVDPSSLKNLRWAGPRPADLWGLVASPGP
jgi:hypothetical protein